MNMGERTVRSKKGFNLARGIAWSRFALALACLTPCILGCGQDDEQPGDSAATGSSRGFRYCELLAVRIVDWALEAEVWGTQGLNDCPAEAWATVDPGEVRAELGAITVIVNGPRFGLADEGFFGEMPDTGIRLFGELEMQHVATLLLDLASVRRTPYDERNVERDSTFVFWSGSEIYQLTSPEGAAYTMISYAQFVDASLTEADLAGLGERLDLPEGWTYESRVLDADLQLRAIGLTTVIQDELQNTYQRNN
jgi:hypothetical protein